MVSVVVSMGTAPIVLERPRLGQSVLAEDSWQPPGKFRGKLEDDGVDETFAKHLKGSQKRHSVCEVLI